LKTEIRNLLSGGVNLAVVVSMDFLAKNLLGGLNIGDIFSDTGSDQMVLEPTVRPFDLTFRLGRKRVDDFDVAVLQDLFPLRGGLIGQKVVFSPEGISSLDKTEDGMRIDIVGEREAVAKDDVLESLDMSPTGFFLDQGSIKEEPTMIIEGGDEIPFLLGGGRPEMEGGVMLYQLTDVTSQNFPVMGGFFGFLEIKAMFLGTMNNCV